MVLNDQQQIMDSLKNKGPEEWLAYLRHFQDGAPLGGLSMEVIFQYAAPLAKQTVNLDWAEVAVLAAELQARNTRGIVREGALLWAMNLRSWFIAKIGSSSNHLVLNKATVLEWVMDGLVLPARIAKSKAVSVKEKLAMLSTISDEVERKRIVDDVRVLRRIKERLNVAKMLVDCGEISSDPILKEWLEIREQLL